MIGRPIVELNAHFLDNGGPGILRADGSEAPLRTGVAVGMDCPCGCDVGLYVPFANPLDGGLPVEPRGWQRSGDTLETLTLTPSVLRRECGWHGWIRDGRAVTC